MSDSRLEKFIYAICSMEVSDLPAPLSRIEKLWNCLITGETPDFEPLSRNEKYLMAMLDRYDISNLPAPMSRGEKLLYKIAVGETDLSDVPDYLSRYEELLKYLIENGGIGFEYVLYTLNQSLSTLYSTAEKPVKSAILTGSTKYRDIDTGDILDTFDETKNLELVSVKMPVLTTTGKNLWNPRLIKKYTESTKNDFNSGSYSTLKKPIIKLKPNTTYKVVFTTNEGSGLERSILFGFKLTDKPMEGISEENARVIISKNNPTYTETLITTDNTGNLYLFVLDYSGDRVFVYDAKIAIPKVDIHIEESKTYIGTEPYKSNILSVPEDVVLRKVGDVQDILDGLTGEVVHNIGEIVLDGRENWSLSSKSPTDTNLLRFMTNSALLNAKKVTSDSQTHYLTDKFGKHANWNNTECAWVHYSNGRVNVVIKKDKLTSLDAKGLQSWLSQNPLTVQYQIATPTTKTIDLTTVDQDGQPTKLKTFNDITHVEIKADNLIPSVDLEAATKINETLSTMGLQHLDISETQNQLGQTIDEQTENTDATMMATTEIYEQTL